VLTGWERGDGALDAAPVAALGALLLAAGLAVVLYGFARFVAEGAGSPSPLAPPERLVGGGPYRYVRHPMYVATAAAIAGQGLLLARPVLLVAAAVYLLALGTFARRVEEPLLRRRFGPAYDAYAAQVPAWLPRPRR
jgi:protein-S-isoprenylcysteine O-methyltransferase Ste14